MGTTLAQTPANQKKINQVRAAWERLLDEALQPGFYGTIGVHVTVHDGTLHHVRCILERREC
jgi:hypothetical protein